MIRKAFISQSNYIPWKGYFDSIRAADVFVLYDDMQYTRRDWRNRNRIKTAQGSQWLTLPVEVKGKYHQKICETRISEPDWSVRHWRTLEQNYKRAPFFEWTQDVVRPLYLSVKTPWLSEINFAFLKELCKVLQIKTDFRWSSEFVLPEDRNERLAEVCRQMGANTYFTGPSAQAYLEEGVFTRAGIEVRYLDFSGYPEYPQLFGAFDHYVSIVDLLFNTGTNALHYMKEI